MTDLGEIDLFGISIYSNVNCNLCSLKVDGDVTYEISKVDYH